MAGFTGWNAKGRGSRTAGSAKDELASMLTFGWGMEGADASEGVTGVGSLDAIKFFEVAADEVVFGTSSTIAVGFETGRTPFPSNGIGLNKRRAAKITVTTSDAELKLDSSNRVVCPLGRCCTLG